MPTASRSSAPPQARPQRAGLWRVLWLAAVLLGVLYTHGASGEIVAEHVSPLTTGAVASAPPLDGVPAAQAVERVKPPGHHGGGSAEHAAQDCASGQPQEAAAPAPPALSPLDRTPHHLGPLHAAVNSLSAHADPPTAGRDPAALRM
ncbi:hypothetical protein QIS99_16810 [Streptomyces sp. B-S-A8]|uniref:Secreted protein n=1 Tax=Streptomyces solicavernae TaxID=3043614 RepID=A0ABT6RVS4_9ACTN|nr:hypothetical protein [Streptomyces sp. B-S-A8]MDI3387848.1 hypothetical protein [Streptomyces sp. B-S-A8]